MKKLDIFFIVYLDNIPIYINKIDYINLFSESLNN